MAIKTVLFFIMIFSGAQLWANEDAHGGHEESHAAAETHSEHAEAPPAAAEHEAERFDLDYKIVDTPQDVLIPSSIWDKLAVVNAKPQIVFVPMKVMLREKTKGVLKAPSIRLQMPRGGGQVDLAQYITDKQGSFYVKFGWDEDPKNEKTKVFFVSRARKRKVDGEEIGAGCKSYFNVAGAITKAQKKDGLLVNTTRLRYLSVIGGTFIFATEEGRELRLSQATFTDKSKPEYFCKAELKTEPNEPAESL